MSEWKLESFSTKSPAASTVTDVVEANTSTLIFTLTGTTDLTSTSCAVAAKPVALTVIWYGLKGTLGKLNAPELSVVVVRSKWLTAL